MPAHNLPVLVHPNHPPTPTWQYTNLLLLHRRFTAQLETLQPRKSEGCIFVDGKGGHDLASLDIDGSIALLWSIGALEAERARMKPRAGNSKSFQLNLAYIVPREPGIFGCIRFAKNMY